MALEFQAETLAEKYRSFNKAVDDATSDAKYDIKCINYDETDMDNLIRIEVASRRKKYDFILDVFKCKDTLYALRAIKLSKWLIINDEYKHIINPDYIHKNLLPHMTLKAFNNLMLKIRLTLRDANRVDEFFYYLKDKDLKSALKWLPYCSVELSEEIIHKFHDKITLSTLEKFRNQSNCVYIYCKRNKNDYNNILKALNILKVNNVERYLEFLFDLIDASYYVDKLSAKSTKRLIKRCPHKTLSDFICFLKIIHIPTLVKSFSSEEIQEVLIKHSQSKRHESLYKYDKLKYFVACLPLEDKLDLIRNVFIGKIKPVYSNESDLRNSTMIRCLTNMNNAYLWCEFLSFDDAFQELKQFIDVESNPAKKTYMLCTLLSSTHRNYDHIKVVLQYYVNSHLHEGFKFKTQFLQHVLHEINTLKLGADPWNLLNILFYSVGVYSKIENSFPKYKPNPFIIIGRHRRSYEKRKLQSDDIFVNCIILYNIIHNIDIPEILLTKFKHATFKEFNNRITDEDKVKLFKFLFEILNSKLEKQDMKDINNFEGIMLTIKNILQLFKDWNKKIYDYPKILTKIQEVRTFFLHEKYDCSELDNLIKSMKFKLETEKSATLPEDLCMNVLKMNHQDLFQLITKRDSSWKYNRKPIRRFFSKLRCYWHGSMAAEFKRIRLNTDKPNWDLPWGLFTEKELQELLQQYFSIQDINTASKEKIEIAKHLHLFRPCVSLETAFNLFKENEIQNFALSIHSLMYNMDPFKVCDIFIKLQYLCSSCKKTSLQKHCLKVALKRLNYEEKTNALTQMWKMTDNKLSRFLVFQETFALLCEATDSPIIFHNWSVLSDFIDNLTEYEDSRFIKLLSNPKDIPNVILPEYCETVQRFFKTLTDITHFQEFTKKLMLDPEEKVKELHKILTKKHYSFYWLEDYILDTSSEKVQMERYEKLLVPLICDEKIMSSEKQPFIEILRSLYRHLEYKILHGKVVVPLAMFTDIQRRLEERLPFYENYVFLTSGRLFLGYLGLLDKNSKQLIDDPDEITHQTQIDFGVFCADFLDDEIEKHFPTIYMSFSDALTFMFHATDNQKEMHFIDAMLSRNPRAECFLTIIHDLPRKTYRTPEDILFCGILEKIRTHPSEEIRMLYSNYFIKTDSL
ncbi:uncharacterized protein LOC123713860 [Pieris brassicae]|uniref:uncharacterized protein LOC123713860 n=1 Tax=Pieris brassicae TaxID=7116 RepID=UPI001E65FF89|nr:uncharacterized protein LOC123713860 [Pieris brassicae]XP_045523812.1 uncharacterized protein LOC123713860 [Pieris brassicae]